jgi:hypothetical protein
MYNMEDNVDNSPSLIEINGVFIRSLSLSLFLSLSF